MVFKAQTDPRKLMLKVWIQQKRIKELEEEIGKKRQGVT